MALGCQLAVLFVRHFNVCPFSRNCNTTAIKLQDTHAHTHTISATAHRYTFTYRYIRPWKRKVYALVCYNFDCFHWSSRISSSNNDCISLPRPLATTHTYTHTQTQKQTNTHIRIPTPFSSQDNCAPFCSNFRFIDVHCRHSSEVWCCNCHCKCNWHCNTQKISCVSSTHFYFTVVCVMYFRLSARNLWKTFENVFAIKVPATQNKARFEQNGVHLVYFPLLPCHLPSPISHLPTTNYHLTLFHTTGLSGRVTAAGCS